MKLCHLCAAKVRLAFRQKDLKQTGEMEHTACGHCRKKRYCMEYELVEKERIK